jgi:hypothetical protein
LALFVTFCGAATATKLSCSREPELTQAMILDDLGTDELVLRFSTEAEEWGATRACESKPNLHSVDEERDAAIAAGWIERVCGDDPERMRLTAEGRRRSSRWDAYKPADARIAWTATVARYERAGAFIVAPGPTPTDADSRSPQRFVTIPGRYVPNEDGQRLYDTGWQRIRSVDRVEKFIFWNDIWARRHGE